MPIYDYSCKTCKHTFEALVRGDTKPTCPECASEDLERHFSLPAVNSETTRNLSLKAAKKRDAAQGKDRMHEQLKYEQSHDRHG
jgi:putative FmdB family regulatory protein